MVNFSKRPKIKEDVKIIKGNYHKYKDWNPDPMGYLLIRIKNGQIQLGVCKKDNVIDTIFTGKVPQEIYYEVARRNLLSKPEHYAYMGKELEKAYLALKYNLEYVQDEELSILNR